MHDCPNIWQICYIQLYHHYINKCCLFHHFKQYIFFLFFLITVYQLYQLVKLHGFSWRLEWFIFYVLICWSNAKATETQTAATLTYLQYCNLHVTYKNGNSKANTSHVYTRKDRKNHMKTMSQLYKAEAIFINSVGKWKQKKETSGILYCML